MPRILGVGNRKALRGQGGGNSRQTVAKFTGSRVPKSTVSRRSVKRLFARDPSKANSLIGTAADKRFDQQGVNTNGAPSRPRVLRGSRDAVKGAGTTPQRSVAKGQKRVVAKINRSLRKR